MKKIFLASISILIFCIFSFGQDKEISPCPNELTVTGPAEPFIPKISQTQIFSAKVNHSENYQIEYKWSVSGGEIVKGQGTREITVFQPEELAGGNVTATVEISGNFPSYCGSITGSESAIISDLIGTEYIQTDVFIGSLSTIKNENLDNFAKRLKENPTAQGYLIWYSKKNLSKNSVENAIQKVTEYLAKEHKIEKERIDIQISLFNEDLVKFWIIPVGATPPTP